jgi:hypothetical protein
MIIFRIIIKLMIKIPLQKNGLKGGVLGRWHKKQHWRSDE